MQFDCSHQGAQRAPWVNDYVLYMDMGERIFSPSNTERVTVSVGASLLYSILCVCVCVCVRVCAHLTGKWPCPPWTPRWSGCDRSFSCSCGWRWSLRTGRTLPWWFPRWRFPANLQQTPSYSRGGAPASREGADLKNNDVIMIDVKTKSSRHSAVF